MDAAASAMWMHFFPQIYIQTIKRKRGKRKDSRKTLEDTNRLQMEMSCSFFLPLIILSIFMRLNRVIFLIYTQLHMKILMEKVLIVYYFKYAPPEHT